MNKLKKSRFIYKENKMKTINDWIALYLTLNVNFSVIGICLVKTFCEGNRGWVYKTLHFLSIIINSLKDEGIVNLKSTEILNLDFLINVIKNTNNEDLEQLIRELPGVDQDFSYNENTLDMINFYNEILRELLFIYNEKTIFKMEANDYEYIVKYIKKEGSYMIYYLEETIEVSSMKICYDIYNIINKEKIVEKQSLKIAEMLAC